VAVRQRAQMAPSARRLKDATRSVRPASGERVAGCDRATRVRAAAGTEAGSEAGLGAGAWLCTCGCAAVRLSGCVHVGWHKGGGGGDKRTSSRVKMSFVTTAMECESRRAEQSCSVSAVLPDPTGPPMPTLRATISLTKAGCCSALRCTHGREAAGQCADANCGAVGRAAAARPEAASTCGWDGAARARRPAPGGQSDGGSGWC